MRAKRLGLLALMALAAINLFTGAPLFAVWVGSRVQGRVGGLSMGAVVVVVLVLAVLCLALIWALDRLGAAHDALIGRPRARRQTAWMKPFNDRTRAAARTRVGALDRILVACVVLATLGFEAWFFFLAGSSIGSG
jgi:hypothetical protein